MFCPLPMTASLMGVIYFKRYRMEIGLAGRDLDGPKVPERYRLLPWDATLLEIVPVVLLIAAIMVVGIYPAFVSDLFTAGIEDIFNVAQLPVEFALR